jgi:predicted glycosyltransferase
VLVRGLPGGGPQIKVPAAVTVHDHLPAGELAQWVCGAGKIICRSGYSTLMDLVRLGKSAILVPTPGQTEQEYLGRTLAKTGGFACVAQERFDLDEALRLAPDPWVSPFSGDFGHFKKVVDDFVK